MAIRVHIDQKAWDKYYTKINRITGKYRIVPKTAVDEACKLLVRQIKIKIGDKRLIKSGAYRRSIHAEVRKIVKDVYQGVVGTWMAYALWLEEGTRPHTIRARSGRALMFKGRKLFNMSTRQRIGTAINARTSLKTRKVKVDYVEFYKSVRHPGTRPYRVFREALTENLDEILMILIREIKKANKTNG